MWISWENTDKVWCKCNGKNEEIDMHDQYYNLFTKFQNFQFNKSLFFDNESIPNHNQRL